MDMNERYPDAAAIARKMKEGARKNPWVPLGVAPRQRYHHFPDGLSLCLTVDIISDIYVEMITRVLGAKVLGEVDRGWYWHLSVARMGATGPTNEEAEFWRRTFFEEEPIIEIPGRLTGVNTRHYFWRIDVGLVYENQG